MNKNDLRKRNIRKTITKISIGGTLLLTSLASGYLLSNNRHSFNMNSVQVSNEDLLKEFNDIYNNSSELQEEWSDIYPELSDFIENYGSYLDQGELLYTLPKLKFKKVDDIADGRILAQFDSSSNTILYSKKLDSKKDSSIKEIKLHEAIHYLFQGNFSETGINFSHKGKYLDEGNASLIVREYDCYSGVDDYEKSTYYVRSICELIGTDKYMTAVGGHDLDLLITYLNEYSSSKDGSKLVDYIDSASFQHDTYGTDDDKKAWEIIEKMYIEKNGISIEESSDVVMKIYSNKLAKTTYEIEGARGYSNAHINKNYFVNIEEPTITYSAFGKDYGTATINENNVVENIKVLEDGYFDENGNTVDNDGNIIETNYLEFNSNAKHK